MFVYEYGEAPKIEVFHCAFRASTLAAEAIPESAGASLKAVFLDTIEAVSALVSKAYWKSTSNFVRRGVRASLILVLCISLALVMLIEILMDLPHHKLYVL